jgi:hypothetical protein
MAYSRSPPPLSPSSQEDWLSRGPQSIKTYSTSSSRHASRTHSLASTSSRAFSSANYESTARIYYIELKSYLKELLVQGLFYCLQELNLRLCEKLNLLHNERRGK